MSYGPKDLDRDLGQLRLAMGCMGIVMAALVLLFLLAVWNATGG